MYDTVSEDYDLFVNWSNRLAFEMPFLEKQLGDDERPVRVLDAACGTGMHAIALAQKGMVVLGADLSSGMVARAHANAETAGVKVRFEVAGFGALEQTFVHQAADRFDAVLCLGNSLPHVQGPVELAATLADFAACLRPGGLLLIQNRNFDAILAERQRWMEPQSAREGEAEWNFLRFYDFEPSGTITFNMITLHRPNPQTPWKQIITSAPLYPLVQAEMLDALAGAGFKAVTSYGDMSGATFEPAYSGNLVITATKRR